jgi:putative FmdB family regulatory protein
MPIYEYVCKDCEKPFEKLVFSGKEKVACPNCGGRRHALQLSVVATPAKLGSTPSYCETGGSTQPGGMGGCGNCGCN